MWSAWRLHPDVARFRRLDFALTARGSWNYGACTLSPSDGTMSGSEHGRFSKKQKRDPYRSGGVGGGPGCMVIQSGCNRQNAHAGRTAWRSAIVWEGDLHDLLYLSAEDPTICSTRVFTGKLASRLS